MWEFVDLSVLENWVCMLRADVDGALWLVDDTEEARFYERCAHRAARVVPASQLAVPLLRAVENRGVQGVVATVRGTDQQRHEHRENVFRPSVGDVASLLLISDACERVMMDICGGAWLTACEKEVGPVLHRAVWIARLLHQLRRVCMAAGAGVADCWDIAEVVRWDVFELAWDRVNRDLAGRGVPSMVLEEVRGTTCGIDVKREVVECDGMDAVRLLAAATKLFQPRGIRAEREVEAQGLIAMMRVAFDLDELEKDEVFWLMKRWERRNPRYPLLRQWRTLDPLGVVLDQRYWQADLSFMVRFLQAGEQLAVFKMDLDNFGAVNRSLGHSAGDEAIRLYCSIVKNVLGSVGEVYRRGGDEVVALVPGLNETRALTLAEEIRSTVEARFRAWCLERGLGSHPTTSIGLVFTEAGRSCEEIVREMDEAQQRAKQEGKNRVARLP